MYQIDSQQSVATIQPPAAQGTPGNFQDTSSPATIVSADWANTVQWEILNVLVAADIAPLKPTTAASNDPGRSQLAAAVAALIAAAVAAATTPISAPGDIKMTGCALAPPGWLICRGEAVSRTIYAALFAAIGTTFGAGDGATTFNVPDFQGYFPRGWDAAGGVDPGRTFGSEQGDIYASHSHRSGIGAGAGSEEPFVYGGTNADCPGYASSGQVHADNIPTAVQGLTSTVGGTETRPKNLAINFIIKV